MPLFDGSGRFGSTVSCKLVSGCVFTNSHLLPTCAGAVLALFRGIICPSAGELARLPRREIGDIGLQTTHTPLSCESSRCLVPDGRNMSHVHMLALHMLETSTTKSA